MEERAKEYSWNGFTLEYSSPISTVVTPEYGRILLRNQSSDFQVFEQKVEVEVKVERSPGGSSGGFAARRVPTGRARGGEVEVEVKVERSPGGSRDGEVEVEAQVKVKRV
jgi:hypothetical protein